MYAGEFHHTVDSKGRLILPSKLRETLGDSFVVTKGVDGCLTVYDKVAWAEFEEKLMALSLTNAESRTALRFFLSGAVEIDIDKQGRFLLPANLREYACLDKDVILAGCGRTVEIWDKEKYSEFRANINIGHVMGYLDSIGVVL